MQGLCKSLILPLAENTGHDATVNALVISPDGRWAGTASTDCTIILWDVHSTEISQEWFAHDEPVLDLAFSPDGRYAASASVDETVKIWDIARDAHIVATLEGHQTIVCCCAWSSDGAFVASEDISGVVQLWDAHTFQRLRVLTELRKGVEYGFQSRDISFVGNSMWLAAYAHRGWGAWNTLSGTFKVFEASNEAIQPYVHGADHLSPRLAVSYGPGEARIWNMETGDVLSLPDAHSSHVNAMAFSPDGLLVLSASHDRTMKIWNAHTGSLLRILAGHARGVYHATFSPCGRYIASASEDTTVRVWRTEDGMCLAVLSEHSSSVEHVAFTPDGTMLWSAAIDGIVLGRRLLEVIPD